MKKIIIVILILLSIVQLEAMQLISSLFTKTPETTQARKEVMKAIYDNNIEIIRSLLQRYDFTINGWDKDCSIPFLHASIIDNRKDCVKFFLQETSADVNARDAEGSRPIDRAVRNNNIKLFDLLIGQKNIDIIAIDNDKTTLFERIAYRLPNTVSEIDAQEYFMQTLTNLDTYTCRKNLITNYIVKNIKKLWGKSRYEDKMLNSDIKIHAKRMLDFFKTKNKLFIPIILYEGKKLFSIDLVKKELDQIANQFECPCKECNSVQKSQTFDSVVSLN